MSCTSFSVIQPITVNLQVGAMLKQPGSRSATVGLDSSEADLAGAGSGYHDLDQTPEFDSAEPEPAPEFEFDQSRDG